ALADDAGERDAAGLPKRTSDYEAVVKPGSKKWFFTNLGRDDQAQAHKRKRKRRASHAAQEPKRVEAGRATQHILMLFAKPKETEISTVYSDQCSMEEELSIAQQIATDTETIYRRVLKDIGSGRGIDAKAVAQTVQGLVESVIRNPDALTWLVRLKSRRHYTYSHSMAVCVLALALGRFLGLSKTDLQAIGMGTLLQDIGKLHVPRLLLDKSEKLTSVEKKIISEHVDAGVKMLKETDHIPMEVLDIVKSHHERYDGSGYPHAMHGDMISPFSAIAGMADTYEAMTSQRPYRNALTSLEALTVMYAMRDKAFPAAMIEHLIHCVGVFPVGSFVLLNTGSVGVVISRNRLQQLKPKVLPILDAQGDRVPHAETIDLAEQPADNEDLPWKITRVVDPEDYSLDPAEFFA
ncbi:MAG: HD-GYP domain-containing protein, partial [Gammaproteobacteria bacterium]|nr:HD-GYP domain-containing protein [Gammaproteobacteria bacterium]